jgi:hypothetical protein
MTLQSQEMQFLGGYDLMTAGFERGVASPVPLERGVASPVPLDS